MPPALYGHIPRPELLAGVRERLIAGTGGPALTSAIQVKQADVLHGTGGIVKSVLARALCADPNVHAAFPDGILWATLGQTPDLTARLREWIETLGGVVGQTAPTWTDSGPSCRITGASREGHPPAGLPGPSAFFRLDAAVGEGCRGRGAARGRGTE